MKKILLSIIYFLACIFSVQAQTLYGTTPTGGINVGGGTIDKFVPATNNLIAAKSFETQAARPYADLVQAGNGKLYGMTYAGAGDYGVIFSFDPSSSTYTILMDFDNTNGANPSGSFMLGSNGKLYGMTTRGGISGFGGVIFSFDPSTSIYTKLFDFAGSYAGNPLGTLVQASDGKLYGTSWTGGINGYGCIFSFDPSSSTFARLHDFNFRNDTANSPYGNLIQANDGKLYGLLHDGGSSRAGAIFSYDPSSSVYTELKDFDSTNGAGPEGSLIQASDGKLYGLTLAGGSGGYGVIFSFDISSSTLIKLKDFDNTHGASPQGSLMQASNGKLYGMTQSGGTSRYEGVIFSFDPSSSTYTDVTDFNVTNGANPRGSLMQASDGKLYGMTFQGGPNDLGVIFSFDPASSTYTKLTDADAIEGGTTPYGSLMQASDGKLYGMTQAGGSNNAGVIYSFDPSSAIYTKLKDFDYTNGGYTFGKLIQAGDGKLYGMTYSGGSGGFGVIFSFNPSSSTYAKLHDFDNINGVTPFGSLMQASDGKLYGMTRDGGSNGFGVIFSYDPMSSTYIKLKDFDKTNGSTPYGSNLIQASDGKLYGMTSAGGSINEGVIFSFDPASSTYAKLHDFDNTNGGVPNGSLIQASDGMLYGMTAGGGSVGNGVIFSFDLSSSTFTKLIDFALNTRGASPHGSLFEASDGKLYGMTQNGGSNSRGVIFSFDPSTSNFAKLQDFDYTNGSGPYIGSEFMEVASTLPVTLISFTGKNSGSTNRLSWKVNNEQNLDYYELQRSTNGQNFNGITQIKAAGNNGYTYNDPITAALSSIYYYRLKSVDKDGKFKYSVVIKITTDRNGLVVVNPNPFKDRLVVTVESLIPDETTFIVTDISGKQLVKISKLLSAGTNIMEINETGGLSKGTYLLTIIKSKQSQTIKVVKGN